MAEGDRLPFKIYFERAKLLVLLGLLPILGQSEIKVYFL